MAGTVSSAPTAAPTSAKAAERSPSCRVPATCQASAIQPPASRASSANSFSRPSWKKFFFRVPTASTPINLSPSVSGAAISLPPAPSACFPFFTSARAASPRLATHPTRPCARLHRLVRRRTARPSAASISRSPRFGLSRKSAARSPPSRARTPATIRRAKRLATSRSSGTIFSRSPFIGSPPP